MRTRRFPPLVLALILCLTLLPGTASAAAEDPPPGWYFLFAVFQNLDADGNDKDGNAVHVTYSMSQEEVDAARSNARDFEAYMNTLGVMRAHAEVVEIDTPVTELNQYEGGSYLGPEQAAPLLEGKADLDRYDHVFCILGLDALVTRWIGVTGNRFPNSTGHTCINFVNREYALKNYVAGDTRWPPTLYIHEFLHFTEWMSKKYNTAFNLHGIQALYNTSHVDNWKGCYTDIILNRAKGNAETGTGPHPAVWRFPPHMLRTMTEWEIPSDVTGIGPYAFQLCAALTELTIPSSVTSIGKDAFGSCTALSRVTIHPGLTTVEVSLFVNCRSLTEAALPSTVTVIKDWAFQNCASLTRVFIPASVTSIGSLAFYKTPLRDIYYGGTEEQWDAIQIGEYNQELRNAAVHYNSRMEDRGVMARGGGTGETVNWVYDRGARVLTVSGSLSRGGTVYVARYDKNGRLLGVAEAGSDQTFDLSACREARLFWLEDGGSRPVCEAARISA